MSIHVGDHVLVVGGPAGTLIKRAPQPADDEAAKLAQALRTETRSERSGAVVGTAEDFTDRVEKGVELAEKLEKGTLLDPSELEQWLGPVLDRIERLDREGRFREALELARVAHRVLVLARRWIELIKLLRGVLNAARTAGEDESAAWAQHELGTLQLAAGQLREADAALSEALSLRRRLGDAEGVAATEQNLRILCGNLRELLRSCARPTPALRRSVLAAIAVLLLLTGAVAHAVMWPDKVPARTSAILQAAVDGRGSVTGGGIDCPGRCSRIVPLGTRVTLIPAPAPGSTFAGWSGDCSGTGVCTVRLDSDRSVTAHFKTVKVTSTLRARVDGDGHVTSRPAGIDCPSTCSTRVRRGAEVALRATADANATFAGWSGGGCSGTGTCIAELTESKTVTARFVRESVNRSLTVDRKGDGTVTSDRGGIDCGTKCDASLADGTNVTLRAQASEGSEFAGWSGGGCTGNTLCQVTMDESRTVTATFTRRPEPRFVLSTSTEGDGTIAADPGCTGSPCGYDAGSTVTLIAKPGSRSFLLRWGSCPAADGTTCTVTMTADQAISATFEENVE